MIEEKLAAMNLKLPLLTVSKGIYKRCLVAGNQVYVSGHVSVNVDGSMITGKLGDTISDENGKLAARQCGLAILASLKEHFGEFDKIKSVVKLLGMINAAPGFKDHALIMNGCSELFRDLWGEENGVGVRSAVGMGSLPGNAAVEVEGIFEIH